MATYANQHNLNIDDIAVSKKEISSAKWKFDGFFKTLSYIIYGVFFGMLPASFKFSQDTNNNTIELVGMVSLFAISIISIAIIYWLFKGTVRTKAQTRYYLAHVFNSIFLSLGLFINIFFPITLSQTNKDILTRQFWLAASIVVWFVFMFVYLLSTLSSTRKRFPLTWSKIGYSLFVMFILVLVQASVFASAWANNNSSEELKLVFMVATGVIYVVAWLVFVFALSYIKAYKDVLLGQRTDFELQAINDWENAKTMAIISSAVSAVTYIVALLWNDVKFSSLINDSLINWLLLADLIVDALLIITYLIVINVYKFQVRKSKDRKLVKIFKSIDNVFMLEIITWTIIVKGVILQGVSFANPSLDSNEVNLISMMGMFSLFSVALIYVISSIYSLHTPHLKNSWISLPSIFMSIMLVLFTIVFSTWLSLGSEGLPFWLPVFMLLILLIGISISLVIRIVEVGKLFKKQNPLKTKKSDEDFTKTIGFETLNR